MLERGDRWLHSGAAVLDVGVLAAAPLELAVRAMFYIITTQHLYLYGPFDTYDAATSWADYALRGHDYAVRRSINP